MYYIAPDQFKGCTSECLINLDRVDSIEKELVVWEPMYCIAFYHAECGMERWTFKKEGDRDAAFGKIKHLVLFENRDELGENE